MNFRLHRSNTLRLTRDLDWFFENRKPLRIRQRTRPIVDAAYAVRPLLEGADPVMILILTPKRGVRMSHDRHKLQRWLREAIRTCGAMNEVSTEARACGMQVIMLLRISQPPSPEVTWDVIKPQVDQLAELLTSKLKQLTPVTAAP
jgi:hypothetical protein